MNPVTQEKAGPGSGRAFRFQIERFWEYWPLPHFKDEPVVVLHVDGLHLGRSPVVLIAANQVGESVGWYLARSEHAGAWSALLAQVSKPIMVVTDGGSGFRKAMRETWPGVRIQRCLFHVQMNITGLTSKNPRLQPGRELKGLAHELVVVKTLEQAAAWEGRYLEWEARWEVFLAQKSRYSTGVWEDAHKNLVRARNMIRTLLRQGQLFTFLDPALVAVSGMEELPSTNNRLEGGVNSQARQMLRTHRGMPLLHRVKTIFWWCYTHSPAPLPTARILREMPTDETIADLYVRARIDQVEQDRIQRGAPIRWGTAIEWEDLHHRTWKR